MKKKILFLFTFYIFIVVSLFSNTQPKLKGEYLGQKPPGLIPELFAPGIISTHLTELNAVFFPGGKELIFTVKVGRMRWMMFMMKEKNGSWTAPKMVSFNGIYGGVDPFVSFDGNRIYFCSNRPKPGQKEAKDFDIWYVDRTATGWSTPVFMGFPINTDKNEFYPTLSRNGTIYFQSRRDGGLGSADIYYSELKDGKYREVKNIGNPINSKGFEGDVFIAPDESYIILSKYKRKGGFGGSDLYLSFKNKKGQWSKLINMGKEINTPMNTNCQMVSPCGRYLFFKTEKFKQLNLNKKWTFKELSASLNGPENGNSDIYWVDAKIIKKIKKMFYRKDIFDLYRKGKKNILKDIIRYNPNITNHLDKKGRSLLHWSGMFGDDKMMVFLLNNGAKINLKDVEDGTPIHWAAHYPNLDTIRLLLKQGARLNFKNRFGRTPLGIAAREGYLEMVKLFLDKGADLKTVNNVGRTPLHNAADGGFIEIYRYLKTQGADEQFKDNEGKSAKQLLNAFLNRRPVKISSDFKRRIIGTYKYKHLLFNVLLQDNRIFIQYGKGRKKEIIPQGNKVFYIDKRNVTYTFHTEKSENIAYLIEHWAGVKLKAIRIK